MFHGFRPLYSRSISALRPLRFVLTAYGAEVTGETEMWLTSDRRARWPQKQYASSLAMIICGLLGLLNCGTALADQPTVPAGELTKDEAWLPRNMTPGLRMEIREVGRRRHRHYTEIDTQLVIEGAPREKRYNLWLWSLAMLVKNLEPVQLRGGSQPEVYTVDESGNWDPQLPSFTIDRYRRGEWFELRLLSTDGLVRGMSRFYPFPIQGEDLGCRVWLALASDDGDAFDVFGEGFEPGEEVKTISISNGEVLDGKQIVAPDGTTSPTYLFPATRRRKQQASYEVIGRSCHVVVKYDWGRPALQIQ